MPHLYLPNSGTLYIAVLYTVEFQKCGLPHCHTLLWLDSSSKITEAVDVDQFISVEIPDPNVDPDGYKVVSDLMVHGPCGSIKSDAPCMQDGRCSKKFPKKYNDSSFFDKDGHIHYCRRESNVYAMKNSTQLDNTYVVPYNRKLCLTFFAHINVEYCEWSMLIKYLFKYISKGTDRIIAKISRPVAEPAVANSDVHKNIDEIQNFVDGRFICPHEASWRILNFNIHYRDPAVQILSVHLEDKQQLRFRSADLLENIVSQPHMKKTTLTEWLSYIRLMMEERCYDREQLAQQTIQSVPQLNAQQRKVYDLILESSIQKQQQLIFVYGHGGTGKTFLWNTIISSLRSTGKIVLAVASSGIASLLWNTLSFIYDSETLNTPTAESLQSVCPRNDTTDIINARVLGMIETDSVTYISLDEAIPTGNDGGETELLYPTDSGNNIELTLWGSIATDFDKETWESMEQPVILAVSSCRVSKFKDALQLSSSYATHCYFNPDTPEVHASLPRYQEQHRQQPPLNVSRNHGGNENRDAARNRQPLQTLLLYNRESYMSVQFTGEVTITSTHPTTTWYYLSCTQSTKKAYKVGDIYKCLNHGILPQPAHRYCFKVQGHDETATTQFTFFTPTGDNILNLKCSELASMYPDTFQTPSQVNAITGQTYTLQFRYKPGIRHTEFIVDDILQPTPTQTDVSGTLRQLTLNANHNSTAATSSDAPEQSSAPATPSLHHARSTITKQSTPNTATKRTLLQLDNSVGKKPKQE